MTPHRQKADYLWKKLVKVSFGLLTRESFILSISFGEIHRALVSV
jgi:hypothetical protein